MSDRAPGPGAGRRGRGLVAAVLVIGATGSLCTVGCDAERPELPTPGPADRLTTYPNPHGPEAPLWSPQPRRDKPQEVVVTPDGAKAYVSLPGTPDQPGRWIAAVHLAGRRVTRIAVGAGPTGLALHPAGRYLVVLNRYDRVASVVDTTRDVVVGEVPMDPYATEAAFSADGRRLFVTNRWRDAVAAFDLSIDPEGVEVHARHAPGIASGSNPRDLALSGDGRFVAVGALTGGQVTLIDAARFERVAQIDLGAPVNGLAFVGRLLVVATLSASTHHLPFEGPDTDGDGRPGDGTPNVNFQDLQNEIAVLRATDEGGLEPVARYTSDTLCCRDYRDVAPDDTARFGHLLPPRDTWIVGGALPEQVIARGDRVYVTYSASNEVQRFDVDRSSGRLTPGPVWPTRGHQPHGLALADDTLLVAHVLSETLGVYDASTGAPRGEPIAVGDLSGGPFPATDAEIGELFNAVTAPFTVDGDQSCLHCHREQGNIDKALSMPLTRYAGRARRMVMAYRGAADTRPWFFEAAMDETNFKPVINELNRIENYCCSDYTLWPDGAPADCARNPPAICATAPNPSSLDGFSAVRDAEAPGAARPTSHASRDRHFLAVARALVGRDEAFGDGLFFEDPLTGERRPVKLDFDGMTRALGLFLLTAPRLLPNPNPPDTAAARRGRALFESPATGCATCHPAPTFAASTDNNPFGVPLQMDPVVTPDRSADGVNLDLFAAGFVATFPAALMDRCEDLCGPEACAADPDHCDDLREVRFGVPTLRGLWDRAPSMLHDGRARSLREVLCTPGHAALRPGEVGYNERDGVFDTHGGTSHLTPAEIDDLIAYLLSL